MTPEERERRRRINTKTITVLSVLLAIMAVVWITTGDPASKPAAPPADSHAVSAGLAEPKTGDSTTPTGHQAFTLPGTPLRAVMIDSTISSPKKGDKRAVRMVTVYLLEDQSQITRQDVAATVMDVAMKEYQRTHTPIIDVWVMAQEMPKVPGLSAAAQGVSDLALARGVYIADGLGGDGKTPGAPWTTGGLNERDSVILVAERGFSEAELEYLRLYRSLYDQYATNGILEESGQQRIRAALAQRMGIPPGSVQPFLNITKPFSLETAK